MNPIGSRLDTGWNITAGAGVNANHHFGLMLDFIFTETPVNQTFLNQVKLPTGMFASGDSRWIRWST